MGHRIARNRSSAWQRVRLEVIRRAGFRCQACRRPGRLEVDHVLALHKGGNHAASNLQALCRRCHGLKTRSEALPGRLEWLDRVTMHDKVQ